MRILVIQLRRIGDILLTTPVLLYLKTAFPGAQVDFLAEKAGKPVLETNPHISKLIIYDAQHAWKHLKEVRANKYDLILDFMNNPRSAVLAGFSGAPWRVGFRRPPRSLFYNAAIPVPKAPEYVPLRKLRLVAEALKVMGKEPPEFSQVRPEVFPTEDDLGFAAEWLARENQISKKFAVLIPIHRHEIRRWRAQGFQQVGLGLSAEHKLPVYVAWGPGEEDILAEVRKGHEDTLKPLPSTTLRQFAALMKHARLAVTNDSGLMHVTVAAGCPTVTVYGPTRPIDWNPSLSGYNQGHYDLAVNAAHLDCLGCHLAQCSIGHKCMNELPAETVLKACSALLKEKEKV